MNIREWLHLGLPSAKGQRHWGNLLQRSKQITIFYSPKMISREFWERDALTGDN